MFKLHHFIGAAFIIASATGCTGTSTDCRVATLDIIGNLNTPDTGNEKDVFETVWTLHPALTDSTILIKPWLAGSDGSRIYLFEGGVQNQLMVFDSADGRCLYSVDRTGPGPEEYRSIWKAWKTPRSSSWTVQDFLSNRILVYSVDGVCEQIMDNDSIDELLLCGDGWVATDRFRRSKMIELYRYTDDWQPLETINTGLQHYVMDDGNIGMPPMSYVSGDKAYLFDSDTLYCVSGDHVEPVIALKTDNLHKPRFKTYQEEKEQREKYIEPVYTMVNDSHALITFCYSGKIMFQVYRLSDGKMLYSKSVPFSQDGFQGYTVMVNGHEKTGVLMDYADNDAFYFIIPSDEMTDISDAEECNPAIVKVRIKD